MAKKFKVKIDGVSEKVTKAFIESEDSKIKRLAKEKEERIREYRREASRLSAMANKRVERLERNNLTDTPAYKTYLEGGRFGVKGKTYNEVQAEVARLNRFLNAQTSTVRGANRVAKEIASTTGIKYRNLNELREKSAKFFELASKAEQYARNVLDAASALGYQKIWDVINELDEANKIDLSDANANIDAMLETVTKALDEWQGETVDTLLGGAWFELEKD